MTRRTFWNATLAAAVLSVAAVPSFAQGPGGPGGGRGFGGPGGPGGGGNIGFLVQMPEVQKELKLDQTQVELLQDLRQNGPRPNFQELQSLSPEERQKRFQAMQADQEKKVGEILNKDQMARLKQLQLQQQGVRALDRVEVANALKLTADQKNQVKNAIQGERETMRQAFQGFQPGGAPPSDEERQANFKKMQDARTATDAKLNAILTPAQKQQFQTMQGAKFNFPQRGPGGFGPAGPGGRRPGGGQQNN